MASYYEVEVRPNASGWSSRLVAQVGPEVKALAEQLKRQLQEAVRDGLSGTNLPGNNTRIRQRGALLGSQYADAFSRTVKAKLEAAFQALPKIKIDANTSAVDRELAIVRRKLAAAARGLELGIDTKTVETQVEALQARLEALARNNPDVRVRVNTSAALAEIEAFKAAMKGEAKKTGKEAGDELGDAFTREVRRKLTAAVESLPKIKLDASSTDVDRELADIRRKLGAADRAVKIGVDTKLVDARLDELRVRLERLARSSPDIRVRVNSGTALAELEALKRSMDGFGRDGKLKRAFAGVFDKLKDAFPIVQTLSDKLGALGDQASKVGDGVKNNPFVGLAVSNVLITALLVALTAVGPLAAGATAALLGMAGAAGVAFLAFKGLKDQATKGKGFGAQIDFEITRMSSRLADLAEVAANAVGNPIRAVLAQTTKVLPTLKGLVAGVGSSLGKAFEGFGTGFLAIIQRSQPIILLVASYIEKAGAAFRKWATGPGFEKFLGYMLRVLPKVVDFAVSFGKALIDAFVAVAPVGEVVLTILTTIFKAISAVAGVVGSIIKFVSGGGGGGDTDKQLANFRTALTALGQFTKGLDTAASTSTGQAAALGVTNAAYDQASKSIQDTAVQLQATTLQMQLQNDAAGLLKQSLDALSGKNLSVASSLNQFQTGLLSLGDTFNKGAFSATAFTETAVAQRGALEQAVAAAQAHAEAVGTQTGSTLAATNALKTDYDQIVANTGATGAQRDAILAYITSIGGIPAVKPTKLDVNTQQATDAVNRFKALYQNLPAGNVTISANLATAYSQVQTFVAAVGSRTAYVQVQTVGPGGPSGGKAILAQGGVITPYAVGGINDGLQRKLAASVPHFATGVERHIPQIARPNGFMRVWAEPETKGEAYIPLANDFRRPRAESILGDVAGKFGGSYYSRDEMTGMAAANAVPRSAGSGGTAFPEFVTLVDESGGILTRARVIADQRIASTASAQRLATSAGPSSRLT